MTDQRDTTVELLLGGAWVDVTSDVLASTGVTINRGRADEASSADSSTCAFTLKDSTGKYNLGNPSSPYYGQIARNTPVRVGVGTPPIGAGTTGQTGTSIVAPSLTAPAAGRLFGLFSAILPGGNLTMPVGFLTGTERDGLMVTCNVGYVDVAAGATGTKTATYSVAATAAAAASVWLPGTVSAISTFSDVTNGGFTQVALSVTAGQHILLWNVWSSDVDDEMRHAPYSDDLNMDWVAVYDSGPSSGQRIRAWLAHVDATDTSLTVGVSGATGIDNYRAIHVITGLDDYWPRFAGYVPEWAPRWDPSEALVTVPVTANGVIRRLSRGDAVPSPVRRSFQDRAGIVAYWPLEDGAGSTAFASGISGGSTMTFLGTPALAADDSFLCSAALPTFTAAGARGAVASHTATSVYYFGALVNFPSGGTADESMLMSTWSVGGTIARWTLKYDTGGPGLRLEAYDRDGVSLLNTAPGPWSPTLPGSRRLVFVKIATDGADVDYDIFVASGLDTGVITAQVSSGTILAQTKGTINTVAIGRELTLTNEISLGHVFLSTSSPFVGTDNLYGAVGAHSGEESWVRFRRLCRELYIDSYTANAELGQGEDLGPQPIASVVDLLRECEAADLGQMYEARGFFGLAFLPRAWKENLTPLVTLDYSAGRISPPLDPTDDDQQLANDVTVTRSGGSSARAVDEDSVAAVGRYAQSVTLNLHTDEQLADQAAWRLHVGTTEAARYPSVRVNLAANPSLIGSVAAAEVGNKITLTGLPSWLPPDDVDLIVEGYSETIIWPNVWDVVFTCSPAQALEVAQIGVDAYDRLDSETTTTAEALDTTETGVDIAVASGSALWCTTALLPAEFPFDVQVGGEVMRVTACTTTGALTQTMTVTRSINGVVKSHSSGAQLRLADPVVFTF